MYDTSHYAHQKNSKDLCSSCQREIEEWYVTAVIWLVYMSLFGEIISVTYVFFLKLLDEIGLGLELENTGFVG